MKKQFFLIVMLLCLCGMLFAGCSATHAQQEEDKPLVQPTEADPQAALDEIYAECTVKNLGLATEKEAHEVLGLELADIMSYHIMYSKGNYGVKDTYIIRPMPGKVSEVRTQLENRQDAMIRQYEHYDIYKSYEISLGALIYEQGDYLIMLMHEDNDEVRAIIDKHIPSK